MEENTNDKLTNEINNEQNEETKNEHKKLNFPAEKIWDLWIIISVFAMATSIIYILNAFMIIVNCIIFMIANIKRLNYRIEQKIVDESLKKEFFSHVVMSKTAMLLILFGIASMGWGYICDGTLNYFLILSCAYSFLVVYPLMKSFQKRILLIKEYDYKEVGKLFNGYLAIAIFCIIFAFILREYLDEKVHTCIAAE